MNNIFENAYFGKAYKTRDGRKAIYYHSRPDSTHELIVEGCSPVIIYWSNGETIHTISNKHLDIVSEWQEEINDEELDKFAKTKYGNFRTKDSIVYGYIEGFKTGYRKAKEE